MPPKKSSKRFHFIKPDWLPSQGGFSITHDDGIAMLFPGGLGFSITINDVEGTFRPSADHFIDLAVLVTLEEDKDHDHVARLTTIDEARPRTTPEATSLLYVQPVPRPDGIWIGRIVLSGVTMSQPASGEAFLMARVLRASQRGPGHSAELPSMLSSIVAEWRSERLSVSGACRIQRSAGFDE